MKLLNLLFFCTLLSITACQKEALPEASQSVPSTAVKERASGNGGGGNQSGFIQNVFPQESVMVGGNPSELLVSFTQPAPAGGWTLTITSNNPALQVPATFFVPAGAFVVHPPITTSAVTNAVVATFSVKLGAQTKSNSIKLFPATPTFPPPSLLSPGNGANFKERQQILFDWNDNNNAWYSHIQWSESPDFTTIHQQTGTPNSFELIDGFGANKTYYWRVRFVDASENPGPWSQVRSIKIKPQ